jgi:NitT/TauT family transport system substrate-binding protein
MAHSKSRWVRVGARSAAVACALTLAACGLPFTGGNAASGETIVIGYSTWPGWWPWAIAEKKNMFEANGVKVEMRWYESYLDSVKDLASGKIDANAQTTTDTLAFAGQQGGVEQTVVMINDISSGNDKIIATADITSVKDLKGRKVAVEPGVVDDFLLTRALTAAGLKRTDVIIVPLETGKAADAFAAGKVDAVAAFPPFWSVALKRKGSHEIASSTNFPWTIWDALAVNRKLVEDRPQAIQSIVNTWMDVLDFMALKKDESFSIMSERAGLKLTTSAEIVDFLSLQQGTTIYSRELMVKAFDPVASSPDRLRVSMTEQANFLVINKFIKASAPIDTLITDKFVNASKKTTAAG